MPLEVATRAPKEALAYWRSKAPVTKAQYEALTERARTRAFTVAGLARQDQVGAIYAALARALEKGEPLAHFKKRVAALIEQQGWVGRRAWRVENIYRTNMQAAYQAGRYAQMKRVARRRPYWRYVAVRDRRTRPTHRALDGKIYPHDHPFWETWYPPNGFACRCTVQTLSRTQVEERGLEVETKIPRLVEPTDPTTGAKLPAVPLAPDPGWAGNVGRDWLAGLAPAELEGPLKDLAAAAVCRDGKGLFASGDICKPPLRNIDPRHILRFTDADLLPKGLKEEEYIQAFLAEFGITDIHGSAVYTLPGGIPVVISSELFQDRRTGKWKATRGGRERYLRLLARTIQSPYEIWHNVAQAGRRVRNTLRLIRLFAGAEGRIGGFVVFDLIGGRQWRGTTIFTPGANKATRAARERYLLNYLEKERSGVLLYREP